jgi:hypothetical protein
MPHGLFTEVDVDAKDPAKLIVKGKSIPELGTGAAVVVAVIDVTEPNRRTQGPVDPRRASVSPWTATIPQAAEPFKEGEEIYVVGVASNASSDEPFLWGEKRCIELKPSS